MRRKAIFCVLIVVALCLGAPAAFTEDFLPEEEPVAEEIFIEESAPAPEEEIFYEEPDPDETQDPSIDEQFEEEIDLTDAEPELTDIPSFLFHTPEDMTITFGVETQSIGFASVSDVADMPEGARIMLHIDGPAFVNVDDPAEIIPLSITDVDGNDVICLWDEFTGERTVELFIHVSAEDWVRAALGGYAATINYRAAVE